MIVLLNITTNCIAEAGLQHGPSASEANLSIFLLALLPQTSFSFLLPCWPQCCNSFLAARCTPDPWIHGNCSIRNSVLVVAVASPTKIPGRMLSSLGWSHAQASATRQQEQNRCSTCWGSPWQSGSGQQGSWALCWRNIF